MGGGSAVMAQSAITQLAGGSKQRAEDRRENDEYRTRNFELRTGGYDFIIQNSLFGIRYF
jgi:hypothetical protein